MTVNRLGTMFGDVLGGLVRGPATERYPFERAEAPDRLRGHVHWDPSSCTGCGLCSKDCPSGALDVLIVDRKAKRFVLRYHLDRCTFCAQCVESCRQGCLSMSDEEWELASTARDPFIKIYGEPDDIEEALAAEAGAGAGE